MDNMMKQPSDPPQPRSKDHVQQCIEEMMEFLTKYKEERSADQEEMFDLNAIRIVEHEVDQSEPQTIVESQPMQMTSTLDREENVQHNRYLVKPHQARLKMIKGAAEARMFDLNELEEIRLESTRNLETSSELMATEQNLSHNVSTTTNHSGISTNTFQLAHQK